MLGSKTFIRRKHSRVVVSCCPSRCKNIISVDKLISITTHISYINSYEYITFSSKKCFHPQKNSI